MIEFGKDIDLADIGLVALRGNRYTNFEIVNVNFTTNIGFAQEKQLLSYKVDYLIQLLGSAIGETNSSVAEIEISLVVNLLLKSEAIEFEKDDLSDLAQFAVFSAHTFARAHVSQIATTLRLPQITLGALRKGAANLDTISVGEKVFNFPQD
jgi:hypothetical protein